MINKEYGKLDNVIVRRSGSVQSSPSAASGYIASGETEAIEVHGTLNTLKTLYQQISEDATDTTKIVSLSYQEAVGKKETPEKIDYLGSGNYQVPGYSVPIAPTYSTCYGFGWDIWATPAFRAGGMDTLRLIYLPAIIPSTSFSVSIFGYNKTENKYKLLITRTPTFIGQAGEHGQIQIAAMLQTPSDWGVGTDTRLFFAFSAAAPSLTPGAKITEAELLALCDFEAQLQMWSNSSADVRMTGFLGVFDTTQTQLAYDEAISVAMQLQNSKNGEAIVWANCRAMPCFIRGVRHHFSPQDIYPMEPMSSWEYRIVLKSFISGSAPWAAIYSPVAGEGRDKTLELQGVMQVGSKKEVPVKWNMEGMDVYIYLLQSGTVNPPKTVKGTDPLDKTIFAVQSVGGIYITNKFAGETRGEETLLCGYSTFLGGDEPITVPSPGGEITYNTYWAPNQSIFPDMEVHLYQVIRTPAKSEAYYDGTITTTYYIPDPSEGEGGGGEPDPSDDPDYESSVVISTTIVQQNVDTMPSGAVDTGDVEQATAQNEACYNALRAGLKYYAWNGKNVIVTEAGCGPLLDRNKRQKALGNYSVSVPQTQATLTWGDKAGRPTLPAPPFANMVWSKMAESTTRRGNKTQHVENWSASPIGGWAMRQSST